MGSSQSLFLLVYLAIASSLFPTTVSAQFHCFGTSTRNDLTFRETRDSADVLVFGKVIYTKAENEKTDFTGRSVVVIQQLEKDKTKGLVKEELAVIPYALDVQPGELVCLPGTVTEKGIEWNFPKQISSAAFQYVAEAPKSGSTDKQRLTYFAKFLMHEDPFIAADAQNEFQISPFEEIRKIQAVLNREELRECLKRAEAIPDSFPQIGSIYLLLGLCGDKSDAEFMKSLILEETEDFRLGIDSVMAGYLLLTGEEGLNVLDEHKLANRKALFYETVSALQSLRFMWKYGEGRISNDRLRQSMRILLKRPNLVDRIIVDLARFQDWEAMDQIVELYHQKAHDSSATNRAIIRYLLIAKKDFKETPDADKPAYVRKAEKYLQQFHESDPKTVKSAERYFFD